MVVVVVVTGATYTHATTRTADLIIVLNDGRIREVGTHEELLARRDLYAELYRLQERVYQRATMPSCRLAARMNIYFDAARGHVDVNAPWCPPPER